MIKIKGIYCFLNKINNKRYIGQSINIEERYKQHIRNIRNPKFNFPLYNSLRKEGLENYDFVILEECPDATPHELDKREIYWISYYDSYNNGYNLTKGGKGVVNNGYKIHEEDVLRISELLECTNTSMTDIAKEFHVSIGLISLINDGKCWTEVTNKKFYPIRPKGGRAQGERVNTSKATDAEVLTIRKRYVNETLNEIYIDYEDRYSYSGFRKLIYGTSDKHIPYYVKRQKKWFLNGTCIDYPSGGE